MSWEDDVDPDFVHELPFWLVAAMAHGALLTLNPILRWGAAARADEKILPVEFVAEIPVVQPNLAPAAGDGTSATPHHGPGKFEAPKIKQGAVDAPRKANPVLKPAAVKGKTVKHGSTVKAHAAKAVAAPTRDPAEDSRRAVARAQAREAARERADEAARVKAERAEAAREAAADARREKAERAAQARADVAERARLKAQERAEAAETARVERERVAEEKRERAAEAARLRAERAEVARLERVRKAEAAREEAERQAALAAERRRVLAEQKAAKAARRAELSSTLATMDDPDEVLDAGAAPPSGRRGGGRPLKTPARAGGGGGGGGGGSGSRSGAAAALAGLEGGGESGSAGGAGSGLSGAARAGAAAALAESPDPGDVAGSGGGDLIDTPAKGGGAGPEGGGVSWSVDGAIGNRRALSRALPVSPDWVATRGLDLTVTVRFQVLPDGRVRPGAVSKTSGFPDIDRRAIDALKRWRFEAAPGAKGDVWGRVTFRFTS